VSYRIPIIKTQTRYTWEWYTGTVKKIDHHAEQVTIAPMDENVPWRIISWVYCLPKENVNENEDCGYRAG